MAGEAARSASARTLLSGDVHPAAVVAVAGSHRTEGRLQPALCAAAEALQQLAHDPRFVGGQIGMVGILQTWTRDLRYHPHIHFLVPGGGLSTDGQRWLRAKNHFFVDVKPLAGLFRGKMRYGLRKQGLLAQVATETWRQDGVVDCRPVGKGATAWSIWRPMSSASP